MNERAGLKPKQPSVVDVSGGESKVRCCKEQYCIRTWNVRSMNQGKLDMIKQIARLNINILGISELKWMGMGKFNQMTIIPTNVDKTPLEEVEYPSQSTKESEMQSLGEISRERVISVCFQGKPFNITEI